MSEGVQTFEVEPDVGAAVPLALRSRLLEAGWIPPDGLNGLADHRAGAGLTETLLAELDPVVVRSLAEDLNVARLRGATARDDSNATRTRAATAREDAVVALARVAEALHVSRQLETQNVQQRARAAREVRRQRNGDDCGGRAADPAATMAALVRSAEGLTTTSQVMGWALERIPAATGTSEVAVSLTGTVRQCLADGVAEKCEQLQVELGEGPTLDASTSSEPVRAHLNRTTRWPRWCAAVARLGVSGAVAVPLLAASAPSGVLTLYTAAPSVVGAEQVEAAGTAGALLSLCLGQARRGTQLLEGMESRTVIGQAQGLLLERYGIGAENAFAVLRRLSNTRHRPLRALATELVSSRAFPPKS